MNRTMNMDRTLGEAQLILDGTPVRLIEAFYVNKERLDSEPGYKGVWRWVAESLPLYTRTVSDTPMKALALLLDKLEEQQKRRTERGTR